MCITRCIYNTRDLVQDRAIINIYLSPCVFDSSFNIFVDAIAVNDSFFGLKIANVPRSYLEAACSLVLNTLNLYYLPCTVYQDTIDDMKWTSALFAISTHDLKEHVYDDSTREQGYRYRGEIILCDTKLSFDWERPPFDVHSVYESDSDKAMNDANFEKTKRILISNKMLSGLPWNTLEKVPEGFNVPCLPQQYFANIQDSQL